LLVQDLECVYREKGKLMPTHGHLYIFNKCVCFHAPKMRPIVIYFTQVTGIKNAAKMTDKVRNKLSFLLEGGNHYNFKRVKNRDQIYETVNKLWEDSKKEGGSMISSISPAGAPQSPFTADSGLKTIEGSNDSPDESGDEEGKAEEEPVEAAPSNEEDYTNLREPTDEELWQAMSKYPLIPNHKEMGKCIMSFGVEEYWDMFHAPEAHYTFDKFFQYRGFKQI
jgi:GRAM domain